MSCDDSYDKKCRSFIYTFEQEQSIESASKADLVKYAGYITSSAMKAELVDSISRFQVWFGAAKLVECMQMQEMTHTETLENTRSLRNGFLWGELCNKIKWGSAHFCSMPDGQCDFHRVRRLQATAPGDTDGSRRLVSTREQWNPIQAWEDNHSSTPATYSDLITRTQIDMDLITPRNNKCAECFCSDIIKELETCKSDMCKEGRAHLHKISEFVKTEFAGEQSGGFKFKEALNQDGDVNWAAYQSLQDD